MRVKAVQGITEVNNLRKDLITPAVIKRMQASLLDPSYTVRKEATDFWSEFFTVSEDTTSADPEVLGPVLRACIVGLRFEEEDQRNVMKESEGLVDNPGD
jgi:hypothetical protein